MPDYRYCGDCPLDGATTPAESKGSIPAKILLVTDTPSENSAKSGRLLSEGAMTILSRSLQAVGFKREDFRFTPQVRCAHDKSLFTAKQRREVEAHCRNYVDQEIKITKPKVVIPLGGEAAKQVFGRAVKITKIRGVPDRLPEHKCLVLPFVNPTQVMLYPQHEATLRSDIATLARLVKYNYDIKKASESVLGDYSYVDDLQFLIDQNPRDIAFDIESTSLRWYAPDAKILTMQFCIKEGQAYTLAWDHPDCVRSSRVKARLKKQIIQLLCRPGVRIVGQNLKYDTVMLMAKTGIRIKIGSDTLMMAALIDENAITKNLDDLIKRYVPRLAGYADLFNSVVDKSQLIKLPLDEFFLNYSAGDADAAFSLDKVLYDIVSSDKKLLAHYNHVSLSGLNGFAAMELRGSYVDEDAIDEFEKEMEIDIEERYKSLLRRVPRSIKRLHAEKGLNFTRKEFLVDILFRHPDGFRLKPKVFTKATKNLPEQFKVPSTSTKDHLPFFFDDNSFVAELAQYIKDERLLTTNIKGFKNKYIVDGMVRPTYHLHRAVTGRSSCVRGDTPIVTDQGIVRADEIRVGDYVFTHKGRWREVTRLYQKPVTFMVSLRFSNGEVLVVTLDHKLLLESGEWVTVRSLLEQGAQNAVDLQVSHGRPVFGEIGFKLLSSELSHDRASGGGIFCERSNGSGDGSSTYTGPYVQVIKKPTVQRKQTEGEESSVRKQMGTGLRGWAGIPYEVGGREEVLCTSYSSGGMAESASVNAANKPSNPPHRRGYEEQFSGQFSDYYKKGTPEDTRALSGHWRRLTIEEVNCAGNYRVYDFEVDEDHSYLACGVFNHNSEDPNGQNAPKRGKAAKKYRRLYIAPEGYVIILADLSQAELRLAADSAKEQVMLGIYQNDGDIHIETALIVLGIELQKFLMLSEDEQELGRFKAKAVNFGFLYGMWWKKFIIYAKTQYGVTFNDNEARRIREAFFEKYAGLMAWHDAVKAYARRHKYVRSYTGRIRHLPMIDSSEEFIRGEAERQAINCLSDDTEILTVNGWRTVDEVSVNDKVYSVNTISGNVEIDFISSVNIGHVTHAKMLSIETDAVSALSTANHRWLIDYKGKDNVVETRVRRSDELCFTGSDKLWLSGNSYDKDTTTWSDTEVALIGWVLTDGFYKHQWSSKTGVEWGDSAVGVTQSKLANIMEIDRIFNRLGKYGYQERATGQYVWTISNETGQRIRNLMPDKTLTGEALNSMSSAQHRILFETMLKGDGSWDAHARRYRNFCAGSKERAEAFLQLCVLVGQPAKMVYRDTSDRIVKKYKSMRNVPKSDGHWLVILKQRNRTQPQYGKGSKWVKWSGRVWCPTTENGTWIAKRNGKVFVTGNSPIQETASSLGVMAIGRLNEEVDPDYLAVISFIHDAIYAYVPEEYAEWGAKTLKMYMETTPMEEWFGIKLRVPIVADVEIGRNLADTYKLKGLKWNTGNSVRARAQPGYDFSKFWNEEKQEGLWLPPQRIPPNNGRLVKPYYTVADV